MPSESVLALMCLELLAVFKFQLVGPESPSSPEPQAEQRKLNVSACCAVPVSVQDGFPPHVVDET